MSDIKFIDGIRIYAPNAKAPDFIVANGTVDRDELTQWLSAQEPQVRFVIKRSKGGKYYAAVDAYKRDASEPRQPSRAPVKDCPQADQGGFEDDDPDSIPF